MKSHKNKNGPFFVEIDLPATEIIWPHCFDFGKIFFSNLYSTSLRPAATLAENSEICKKCVGFAEIEPEFFGQ